MQNENIQSALSALGLFKEVSDGAIAVDTEGRIAWINKAYLELLGLEVAGDNTGKHINALIPESRLPEVAKSGKPIQLDIMRFGDRHFVVCRLPLHGQHKELIGSVGFVIFENLENLSPLLSKFRRLERELKDRHLDLAKMRKARFSLSSYLGTSQEVLSLRKLARQIAQRESPVLINGETGVGKELLAHGIQARRWAICCRKCCRAS